MYGRIGGNTDAQLVRLKSVVNTIGESEPQEASAVTLHGWLDMTGGDSRYTAYYAKTEESTHVFVCDWVQLPENISPENCCVTANQTSGQKNEPRSTSAQIPYSVHHNELQ